jgi:hypothetical protein
MTLPIRVFCAHMDFGRMRSPSAMMAITPENEEMIEFKTGILCFSDYR